MWTSPGRPYRLTAAPRRGRATAQRLILRERRAESRERRVEVVAECAAGPSVDPRESSIAAAAPAAGAEGAFFRVRRCRHGYQVQRFDITLHWRLDRRR